MVIGSLLFTRPVLSDSLWPCGLQHAWPPCPSPSPRVCPSSCSLHRWCHPAISSSDTLFFRPWSFPASGTFPVSRLCVSDDQNTVASASAWRREWQATQYTCHENVMNCVKGQIGSYIVIITLHVNGLNAPTERQTGWTDENMCTYTLPLSTSLYLIPQVVCNYFILLG